MIKKTCFVLLCFLNGVLFACPGALPTDNPNFCGSFKAAAICHCTSSGIPGALCQDINSLYNRMIGIFGSLEKACNFQHHTSFQDCMDNWKCYRQGGIDSRGRVCSSNQNHC